MLLYLNVTTFFQVSNIKTINALVYEFVLFFIDILLRHYITSDLVYYIIKNVKFVHNDLKQIYLQINEMEIVKLL